jgi:hypothetical protein
MSARLPMNKSRLKDDVQISIRGRPGLSRRRQFHTKVRTGCDVCKARRIKCPEQRPVCQRCEAANRICTYTEVKANVFEPSWVHYSAPAPSTALTDPGARSDKRALRFYLERTAPELSAYGDLVKDFWGVSIPQFAASSLENPVRHITIALASRQEKTMTTSTCLVQQLQKIEGEHYASSLSSLNRASTIVDLEMLMAASFCFIAYGNIQSYKEQTAQDLIHFSSALKIVVERARSPQKQRLEFIDRFVAPMLARMEHMFSVWMTPQSQTKYKGTIEPPEPALPQQFSSILHARQAFVNIVCYRHHSSIRHQPWQFGSPGFGVIRKLLLAWYDLVRAYDVQNGAISETSRHRTAAMLAQFRLLYVAFVYSARTDLHIEGHIRPNTVSLTSKGQVSLDYVFPERYMQLMPALDWESKAYSDPLQVGLWPRSQVTSITEKSAAITLTFVV